MKFWLGILVSILLVLGFFQVGQLFLKNELPEEKIQTVEEKSQDRQQEEQFIADLNSIVATDSAKIAVAVVDLNSGKEYQILAREQFLAASTMKTLVAAFTFSKIEKGELEEDKPLGNYDVVTQIKFMINNSSNPAWELLNNLLGLANIESFGRSLGMAQVDTNKNLTSANDLAILLSKLYKGQILKTEYKERLFSFMQNTETENRITVGLPNGTKFYHKTGTYADVVHDSAIIDDGKRPFVLVVLTSGKSSEKFKIEKIVAVAKKVWQFQNL